MIEIQFCWCLWTLPQDNMFRQNAIAWVSYHVYIYVYLPAKDNTYSYSNFHSFTSFSSNCNWNLLCIIAARMTLLILFYSIQHYFSKFQFLVWLNMVYCYFSSCSIAASFLAPAPPQLLLQFLCLCITFSWRL